MTQRTPRHSGPVAPHPHLSDYYENEDSRQRFVNRLFDVTAGQYDWITGVMSIGSGVWYRRAALRRAGLGPGMSVLDLCIGTGQVARAALDIVGENGWVVGLDASRGMLVRARGVLTIELVQGYVEKLPIADASFDFVSMGYALRHVTDLGTAFAECRRVLKPGGTLLVLELTRPSSRLLHGLLRVYLGTIVPWIASLGGRDARTLMRYFWDTVEQCVPPETIVAALDTAGLPGPRRNQVLGVFSEYIAVKPA